MSASPYIPVFTPVLQAKADGAKKRSGSSSSSKGKGRRSPISASSTGHMRSPSGLSHTSDPDRGVSGTQTSPRSVHASTQSNPDIIQLVGDAERMFVQARYDFTKTDPSALSFNKGDIIEVYGRLESGWWDGMLHGVRGWFPSNYVQEVDTSVVLAAQSEPEQEAASESGFETLTSASHGAFDVCGVDMSRGPIGASMDTDGGDGDGDLGWHAMGQTPYGGDGLDNLARGILDTAGMDDDDDGAGFEAFAEERKKRQERQKDAMMESMNRLGMDDLGPEEMDQFGVMPRGQRGDEATVGASGTVRPALLRHSEGQGDPASTAQAVQEAAGATDKRGNEESAWEPTLTPDGQVYYHNTVTGEDSWHLPPTDDPDELDDDLYDDDDAFFNSFAGSSAAPWVDAGPSTQKATDVGDSFRPPSHFQNDLPNPWITRMSDDGREWLYYNRLTGQETRERPQVDLGSRSERHSSGSSNILPARSARARRRPSIDVRRKRVADWCARTRREFASILAEPRLQNMAWYVDQAQDALQEVRECAMQGGEAEEEISRAMGTFSQAAAMEAMARREDARGTLKAAHEGYKQSLRNLFTAFGYVGPMDGITEMPRPKWADERTMLGVQGMLASSVHAVIHSGRPSDGAANVWQALKRDVNKCQDAIGSFPALVTPNAPAVVQHGVMGKRVVAQFGFGTAGTIMAGRWGFGTLEQAQHLRPLDEAYVRRLRARKEAVDQVPPADHALDLIRAANRFKLLLLDVDIAVAVDVDGEMSDQIHLELARTYQDLVIQAGNALLDLEEATAAIDELCIVGLGVASEVIGELRERLNSWLDLCINAIGSLWAASTDQRILSDKGNLLDQIGHRSPLFVVRQSTSRPQSLLSTNSRVSRGSLDPSRIRGLDEELLEQYDSTDDFHSEKRDRAGVLVSASTNASQSSLALQSQQVHGRRFDTGPRSAASSTTSLGYGQAESETGSMRSKRTSLMKFMKGRSGDDDGRSTTRNKKKLAKIFGEDEFAIPTGTSGTLASATVPPPPPAFAPSERPWYLGEDYAPEEILLDEKGTVKAGTLNALVARLTPHGSTDTAFFQAFLLTFRSFTTGKELIELLIRRYHIEPPEPGLTEAQLAEWKKLKQTPIRLRVSNTIRSWLDVHYLEAEDADVLDRIEQFATTTLLDNGSELLSRQLVALVNRRRQGEKDTQRRVISGGLLSPPAPLLPKTGLGRPLKLTDINPIELARQLTILEFNYFQAIKPNECLNRVWQDNENKHLAPNVRQVIRMANLLSSWVASTILAVKQVKDRAGVIKYFIQTCMELRALNNFSSMASLMAGLNSAPILRLRMTKEFLSAKTENQKAILDRMLDSTKNFQNYKDMLKTINPPCVPFFGFWLSALVFIEDGNKDYITPNSATTSAAGGMTTSTSTASLASSANKPARGVGTETTNSSPPKLINFFKRSLTSEILRDIQQYQSQPYNLARCKPVYDWLLVQLESLESGQADMQELYEVSLKLEPRVREEERITRMLHDSGFI